MNATLSDDREPTADNLRVRLRECRAAGMSGLPMPELLRYTSEVARELDTLHAESRAHGNVKPDSILLIDNAAHLADPLPKDMPSEDTVVVGTPAYMAPEAWVGAATAESDQYSLACTYVELRRGTPPFQAANVQHIMRAHQESPPDLAACSDNERQVLTRALSKDRTHRYPNCRVLIEDLRRAICS